jgi:hypothetical protein
LKNSKWLPENCKGLRKVLAKIEGLNIFEKTQRELKVNKPELLLPIMTKVQRPRSLGIILQQNRDICAPEIYATWSKFQHSQKMRPPLIYKTTKFQFSVTTCIWKAELWKKLFES